MTAAGTAVSETEVVAMVQTITAAVGIAVAVMVVVAIAAATIAGFSMAERITAAGATAERRRK